MLRGDSFRVAIDAADKMYIVRTATLCKRRVHLCHIEPAV